MKKLQNSENNASYKHHTATKKVLVIVLVSFFLLFSVGIAYFLISSEFFSASAGRSSLKQESMISPARSFNPEDERNIGYEFLDDGEVVHIWNTQDDYFFNKDSGIQLTNHYEDYWTRNIFCIGYYDGDEWIKIKCADELTNFERSIESDDETYVNATLWKEISFIKNEIEYNMELKVHYHLGLNDKNLSITISGKNTGINIPVDLGFAWKVTDLDVPPETTDKILINNTSYNLDGNYDLTFKDMKRYVNTSFPTNQTTGNGSIIYNYSIEEIPIPFYKVYDRESGLTGKKNFLRIDWNENLDYSVKMYGDGNQENFYTALLINAGHFNSGQEKSTTFYWIDALIDNIVSYYKFDDDVANTDVDDELDVNEGTLVGGETTAGVSVPGQINTAFDLDGNDYVSATTMGSFGSSMGTGFSFSFWINTTQSGQEAVIGVGNDVGNFYFTFYINYKTAGVDEGKVSFFLRDEDSNTLYFESTNDINFRDGNWHHIVFTADPSNDLGTIYLDGSPVDITYTAQDTADNTANFDVPLFIGAHNNAGPPANILTARLDEIGIWDKILSSGEVTELWANLSYPFEITPPTYSNNQTNTTGIGESVLFSILYDDDSALHPNGQYIFSTNNTGTWTNESAINFTATPSWANVTMILNSTLGTVVGYRWYADDNSGKVNNTPIYTLTTIDALAPNIILNLPIDNYNSTSNSITFNGTVSDNLDLVNVSLYGNWTGSWLLNETNSSGINNVDYIFTKIISDGTYIWNYYACDSSNNCNFSAANRTFTINTTPYIQFENPTYANDTNSSSSYIPVNVSLTETYFENITFNFYNETLTSYFYDDSTRFINERFADGIYYYNVTVWTTTGQTNYTETRRIFIDVIVPEINITYPTAIINYHIINTNLSLNWTVSDAHLDSCWYDYSGTNVSVTCLDNTTQINITEYSNRNITFWANDTFGNLNSYYQEWGYKVFENFYVYNTQSYEMATETFSINISSDGNEIILGNLVYNGTSHIATKTGDDYNMEFNRTISLSQIGNVSFYWSFNYGGEILNSSLFYQNVSLISMGSCDGALTIEVLNFTAYDEENRSGLIPYDFYGTFEYWLGVGAVKKNFSVSNPSVNETLICINVNQTFYSNAIIQYEKTGYVKRNYYLINETLTNSSQNIDLFLLITASSTSFIIDVIDDAQFSIANAYIHIQRYYAGTDTYETVEMALTDDSGSTVGHFEAETEDYRVIIEQDGVIIYQSGRQKIFCRETPCTLTFQTEAAAGITWEDFGVIEDFDWTLDFDETTNIWTFVYTDTSGSIGYGRLYVFYESPDEGEITICNTSSDLLADTLTCDATGYNGTIYAKAYLSRSPELLVYLKSVIIGGLKAILGLEGLFLSMFVLLLLGLLGLWNPAVGIISVVGGMIILNFMGLASFGAVTIWGIIFIAFIILWELKS